MANEFYQDLWKVTKGNKFVWNSSGSSMLIVLPNGRLRLYDTETAKLKIEINLHKEHVNVIAWNPGARRATSWIVGTEGGKIYEINESGHHQDIIFEEEGEISEITYNARESIIAFVVVDDTLITYNMKSHAIVGRLDRDSKQPIGRITWNLDGDELLATIGWQVIRLDAACNLKQVLPDLDGNLLTFSPDGKTLLSNSGLNLVAIDTSSWKARYSIRCRITYPGKKTESDEEMEEYEEHGRAPVDEPESVSSGCWSPDGRYLVGGTTHGEVHLFDGRTGKHITFLGDRGEICDPVTSLGWCPDGSHVVASWESGEMNAWNVRQWLIDNEYVIQCPKCKKVFDVAPRMETCPACDSPFTPPPAVPINDSAIIQELAAAGFRMTRIENIKDMIPEQFRSQEIPLYYSQYYGQQDGYYEEGGRVVGLSLSMQRQVKQVKFPPALRYLTALRILKLHQNVNQVPDEVWFLKELEYLSLFACHLSELPPKIGDLSKLKILDLSGNKLASLPESLGQLDSLQILDLTDNALTSLPEAIGKLKSLEKLIIVRNPLVLLPDTLGGLVALRHLELRQTQISTLPDSICTLGNLEKLEISSPNLEELPADLGRLHSLKILELECPKLKSIPSSIGSCKNLEKLNMDRGSQISEIPDSIGSCMALKKIFIKGYMKSIPSTINQLKHLEAIGLSGNRIEHVPDNVFQALDSLRGINLENNDLSKLPASICTLRALENLDLHGNKFNTIPEEIAYLPSLQYLDMRENAVTSIPEFLATMHLRTLDLTKNPLNPDAASMIQRLKPKVPNLYCDPNIMQSTQVASSTTSSSLPPFKGIMQDWTLEQLLEHARQAMAEFKDIINAGEVCEYPPDLAYLKRIPPMKLVPGKVIQYKVRVLSARLVRYPFFVECQENTAFNWLANHVQRHIYDNIIEVVPICKATLVPLGVRLSEFIEDPSQQEVLVLPCRFNESFTLSGMASDRYWKEKLCISSVPASNLDDKKGDLPKET